MLVGAGRLSVDTGRQNRDYNVLAHRRTHLILKFDSSVHVCGVRVRVCECMLCTCDVHMHAYDIARVCVCVCQHRLQYRPTGTLQPTAT